MENNKTEKESRKKEEIKCQEMPLQKGSIEQSSRSEARDGAMCISMEMHMAFGNAYGIRNCHCQRLETGIYPSVPEMTEAIMATAE